MISRLRLTSCLTVASFVGVFIENDLKFKTSSKLAREIGIIAKCRKYINNTYMIIVYDS